MYKNMNSITSSSLSSSDERRDNLTLTTIPTSNEQSQPFASIKVYSKRYLILIIFVLFSIGNQFHWLEYSIIANVVMKFYDTTNFWVNNTSNVFMITYIIAIIPAAYLLEKKGIRFGVAFAAAATAFGSWIKVF